MTVSSNSKTSKDPKDLCLLVVLCPNAPRPSRDQDLCLLVVLCPNAPRPSRDALTAPFESRCRQVRPVRFASDCSVALLSSSGPERTNTVLLTLVVHEDHLLIRLLVKEKEERIQAVQLPMPCLPWILGKYMLNGKYM